MDLFAGYVELQRIELVARLITKSQYTSKDWELALDWIADLTCDLVRNFEQMQKRPQSGGVKSGGSGSTLL